MSHPDESNTGFSFAHSLMLLTTFQTLPGAHLGALQSHMSTRWPSSPHCLLAGIGTKITCRSQISDHITPSLNTRPALFLQEILNTFKFRDLTSRFFHGSLSCFCQPVPPVPAPCRTPLSLLICLSLSSFSAALVLLFSSFLMCFQS